MKKSISILVLSLFMIATGYSVYAACNPGSLKSGEPGKCIQDEPTLVQGGGTWARASEDDPWVWVHIPSQWEPGMVWCDLNQNYDASCWVSIYPE